MMNEQDPLKCTKKSVRKCIYTHTHLCLAIERTRYVSIYAKLGMFLNNRIIKIKHA